MKTQTLPLDLLTTAFSKGLEADAPAPGEYTLRGRATVEVDCTITKGQPVESRPSYKPDWPAAVGLLLKHFKVPPERVRLVVESALTHAEQGQEAELYTAAVIMVLGDKTKALPATERAGATKVAGKVEIVGFEER